MNLKIYALSHTHGKEHAFRTHDPAERMPMIELALKGIGAVGGEKSSGLAIKSLKAKDDYAIVGIGTGGATVTVHPLKGKNRQAVELDAFGALTIEDLTLMAVPVAGEASAHSTATPAFLIELGELMREFSERRDLEKGLEKLLHLALELGQHQKGLIITKNLSGHYQIVARHKLKETDPWLSESLLKQALEHKKPIILQNIIGSGFDLNRSLVSTGFVSIYCWPLVVRGEALGALVTGSILPQAELPLEARRQIELLVQAAAVSLRFHLDDLRQRDEIRALRQRFDDMPFLTESPALQETLRVARSIANSDLAVLIQGETGVGKEVMARFLHETSGRSTFIAVNCGAIPAELLESLLFGHRKGAFTGATSDQTGKFVQADGGTLLLDEIGDMPAPLQAKLLRVLQERAVEPLGQAKPVKVDVRVIAASHKPILQLVREGRFREDLYYRLAEITLEIPPLRDRPGDLPLLANHFLREFASGRKLGESAWRWLLAQPWRGNVRELKSALKRAALLARSSEIEERDFVSGPLQTPSAGEGVIAWLGGRNLEDAKQIFLNGRVREALRRTGGNRTRAAELLGVTPRTLFRYIEDNPSMTDLS